MATKPSRANGLSPEEAARRVKFSLSIAVLFVLTLIASGLPLPQRVVVVAPVVVVMVVAVREMRRLAVVAAPALTRFGPLLALGLSVLLLLGAITQAVFYAPQKQYEECLSGANTQAAQAVCGQQRQRTMFGALMEF
ncbi:MAG: hypothetical protein M3Y26_03730 [Actinomycetota bacterium]|nr:hypothetical protein [Actinomycetota bacterium]